MIARPDSDDLPVEDDTPTDYMAPREASPARVSADSPDPAPACVLRSRYVLEEVIGRGGMSIIYRARDLHRDLPQDVSANFVAIKVLRSEQRDNPWALTRLKREFRQMQSLSHSGIVRVFDLDCDDDIWFMSMEMVAGKTVKAWMATHDSRAEGLRIIRACCEALEHAHSMGIVHADLKSTNVMVAADGTIKLIDFSSAPNLSGCPAGDGDSNLAVTPLYASPQVLAGKTPEQSDDVFSLACLSYSILSGGRHPFGGHPSLEDGRAKLAPTYVRSIPIELFPVLERGLCAERERRPSSVAEFLRQLNAAEQEARRQPVQIDDISHAIPPVVIKEIHSEPHWMTADTLVGARRSYQRMRPFVRLTAMAFAIVAAAVFFRLGTHKGAIRAADLSSEPTAAVAPSEAAVSSAPDPERAALMPAAASLRDSGVISFDAPNIRASAEQTMVAVTVKRRAATAVPGAFVWRVERGSAYPGVDYERMEPQVVHFTEGQTARTLFIPLIRSHTAVLARGPRTFTVELRQMAGGPALGRFARVTVDLDSAPTSRMVANSQLR